MAGIPSPIFGLFSAPPMMLVIQSSPRFNETQSVVYISDADLLF